MGETIEKLGNIISTVIKWLFGIAILGFVVWWVLPDDWRIKYAAEYTLDLDQIAIDHKPHNCEWESAPLGNKHCHYDPLVAVYNATNQIVDGTGVGTQPKPADTTPAKVIVVWQRVEE